MLFKRFSPAPGLEKIIDCYWMARDSSLVIQKEKIIPDGFTEIIFHKGDPYRICMDENWILQPNILFAGQISRHFFLENTGISDIIGIKLRPTAFTQLYRLPAWSFTNQVVPIGHQLPGIIKLGSELDIVAGDEQKIEWMDNYFSRLLDTLLYRETAADTAVEAIFSSHGMLQVGAICTAAGIGERQLENLFKEYVGLSPKLFARIVRFNYIFQLVQENDHNWCSLAYEAAYYDQSHFIRNFKSFTGESPSDYAFDKNTMANFFLNKK